MIAVVPDNKMIFRCLKSGKLSLPGLDCANDFKEIKTIKKPVTYFEIRFKSKT